MTFAICALLCAGLYVGLSFSLQREVDTFLEGEIPEFRIVTNEHLGDMAALQDALRMELGSRARHDLAFRLLDQTGTVLASSEKDDDVARLWRPPPGWGDGPAHFLFRTVRPQGSQSPHRTCSLGFTAMDGKFYTAQASYRMDRTQESLMLFRWICVIALAVAVLLSLLSGRVISERALSPIRALTASAERINAHRLAERVPTTGAGHELDQLAVTINDMLDRIERHVQQIRQFTADASHELRTPIAALRGEAEVALHRDRSVEDLRDVIANSIEHYDRLTRIAEDLLLLAKADAGHQILRRDAVHVNRAVRRMADLYDPLARDKDITLDTDGCQDIELIGDDGRLRQLVGNLLDNAIQHTEAGGRITISLRGHDNNMVLELRDTGSGISAEHLPRVFDRFYRADPARSARRGGAGLGLSICRVIAEGHGGTIGISSTPGVGTTVVVTLPMNGRSEQST